MGTPRTLSVLVLIVMVGTTIVTGCAPEPATPTPSLSAPASAPAPSSSDSSPIAVPSAPGTTDGSIDLEDPSTWVVDVEGIGPVRLGETISAARSDLVAFSEETTEVCPTVFFSTPGGPDIWLIPELDTDVISQVISIGDGAPEALKDQAPVTSVGIGVGATDDDLFAAYPGIQNTTSAELNSPARTTYAVAGDHDFVNFAIFAGLVSAVVVSHEPLIWDEFCG